MRFSVRHEVRCGRRGARSVYGSDFEDDFGLLNFRRCVFPPSRRTSGMESQQLPLGDDKIGQPEQAEELWPRSWPVPCTEPSCDETGS
jgi:hypothetical protein